MSIYVHYDYSNSILFGWSSNACKLFSNKLLASPHTGQTPGRAAATLLSSPCCLCCPVRICKRCHQMSPRQWGWWWLVSAGLSMFNDRYSMRQSWFSFTQRFAQHSLILGRLNLKSRWIQLHRCADLLQVAWQVYCSHRNWWGEKHRRKFPTSPSPVKRHFQQWSGDVLSKSLCLWLSFSTSSGCWHAKDCKRWRTRLHWETTWREDLKTNMLSISSNIFQLFPIAGFQH